MRRIQTKNQRVRVKEKTAFYKTVLRTLLLENESISPTRLRQIIKPYLRMLS